MASAFSQKSIMITVADKLDTKNFHSWKQLVLATLHGQELENHIDEHQTPKRFTTIEDEADRKESEEYKKWRLQDYNVVSWLLSSIDTSFKRRMVGCEFAYEIWGRIEEFFTSQTLSKVRQLKQSLKNIKKDGVPAAEYLLQIKKMVDSLAVVGHPLTTLEHMEVILDGLNEDYSPFITSILIRKEPYVVSELEALLMSQEELIERFKKPSMEIVQANYTSVGNPNPRNFNLKNNYGRRGRGGRNFWANNRPQCQLCGHFGHLVQTRL